MAARGLGGIPGGASRHRSLARPPVAGVAVTAWPLSPQRFREYEREHAEHGSLSRRARALLWFWQAFYSARSIEIVCGTGRSSSAARSTRSRAHAPDLFAQENLEVGTGIRYEMWVKVVHLLSADDGSPTAILSSPIELPRFDNAHPFPPEPAE